MLQSLRMRFFEKIQDWTLKSDRLDPSVPLTHHEPKDLGLICLLSKETQNSFRILSDVTL